MLQYFDPHLSALEVSCHFSECAERIHATAYRLLSFLFTATYPFCLSLCHLTLSFCSPSFIFKIDDQSQFPNAELTFFHIIGIDEGHQQELIYAIIYQF